MRKYFSKLLHEEMGENQNIIILTADLGYGLWDKIKMDYPDRFYNVKASEQLMVGMATGMAMEGKIPIVYSITPFVIYRPFEWIRNYLNHEKIPVKLVGGGRDKDYGVLGFSHWAEDDKEIMHCFKNIMSLHPKDNEELKKWFHNIIYNEIPYYINLRK